MIRALEPLKAMVTTVSEECTQQILALQEKEKVEINTLKQEKHHLLKFIDNMKEEKCSLQTQVNKATGQISPSFSWIHLISSSQVLILWCQEKCWSWWWAAGIVEMLDLSQLKSIRVPLGLAVLLLSEALACSCCPRQPASAQTVGSLVMEIALVEPWRLGFHQLDCNTEKYFFPLQS